MTVNAKIISMDNITKVEVYLNDKLVPQNTTSIVKSGNEYHYFSNFSPSGLELQNKLKIRVENTKNSIVEKEIILFK